jgi:hypothetical protein
MIRNYLILLIGIILTLSGILYIASELPNSPIKSSFPSLIKDTQGQSIAKPAPVEIKTAIGIIENIDKNDLTLKVNDKSQNYNTTKTFVVEKITAGSVEAGNAKTIPIQFSELKVKQEVLIVSEKDSNFVRSIFVIK